MNLLTIIILLVLLVFAINGYMRGFARTLTSLLFFVFSGVLVYYSTPYVNDFLKPQTPVYSFVESKCKTLVEDAIMDKLDKETQKFAQQSDVPRKDQNKIIKSLPIPKELQTQLLDNNNSYTYANMAVQTFSEYISTYLADMILNMLTYFISFNLVSIALHAVARALRIMTRLPILRGVNRMCGGALGFVKGICIVWLFFLVVAICSNTEIGSQLLSMIKESPILTFLYESNVFLRYILKL